MPRSLFPAPQTPPAPVRRRPSDATRRLSDGRLGVAAAPPGGLARFRTQRRGLRQTGLAGRRLRQTRPAAARTWSRSFPLVPGSDSLSEAGSITATAIPTRTPVSAIADRLRLETRPRAARPTDPAAAGTGRGLPPAARRGAPLPAAARRRAVPPAPARRAPRARRRAAERSIRRYDQRSCSGSARAPRGRASAPPSWSPPLGRVARNAIECAGRSGAAIKGRWSCHRCAGRRGTCRGPTRMPTRPRSRPRFPRPTR